MLPKLSSFRGLSNPFSPPSQVANGKSRLKLQMQSAKVSCFGKHRVRSLNQRAHDDLNANLGIVRQIAVVRAQDDAVIRN
jgi:hypothetical protein